jgi:hypothetical protein
MEITSGTVPAENDAANMTAASDTMAMAPEPAITIADLLPVCVPFKEQIVRPDSEWRGVPCCCDDRRLTLRKQIQLSSASAIANTMRTYGSKPRRFNSTDLWDGSRDLPRRPLAESNNETNEQKNVGGLGGLVKGVVGWLTPKKAHQANPRTIVPEPEGSESELSLSNDDEKNISVASTAESAETAETLIASTPTKENKSPPELITGTDLLMQFCASSEVLKFGIYVDDLLQDVKLCKLGEASYSEVFTLTYSDGTTRVLKIIPFFEGSEQAQEKGSSSCNMQDVLQEIRISRAMANVEGFADFQGYQPIY